LPTPIVIYQDRNAGGGWYRVFRAYPDRNLFPADSGWNIVDGKLTAIYEGWLKHGGRGKWAQQAADWAKVAGDPQADLQARQVEYDRHKAYEAAVAAEETKLSQRRASGQYGVTLAEARKLRPGSAISISYSDEPYLVTQNEDGEIYAMPKRDYHGGPFGEYGGGGVGLQDIKKQRNPVRERKACPDCGQRITVPHTAVELVCPHCDARLGVVGGRR